MSLQPQDILIALKIAILGEFPTYRELAKSLHMSVGEAHQSVKRAIASGLLSPRTKKANKAALSEFLIHGIRYVFPVKPAAERRGMPTAHGASPLNKVFGKDDKPPIWPDKSGVVSGPAIKPLYKSAPQAAKDDEKLYEFLALVDALRIGRARERKLAQEHLEDMLSV